MLDYIDITKKYNILIIGYGISGQSTYLFLKNKGHNVLVFEDSEKSVPNRVWDINWQKIDLVVKSPSIKILPNNCHEKILEARKNNIEILSTFDIFRIYNREAKIIAITGTNGKSTTSALVYHILQQSGFSVQLGGNIGIPYGAMPKADIYVLEMSSYELASSKYLDFEIAAVLNITPDHLEFHQTFENYISAKHAALNHAKTRIISFANYITMEKYYNTPNTITVYEKPAENANIYISENTLIDNTVPIINLSSSLIKLRGTHNHQNILFAYSICKEMGVSPKKIEKHIMTFKPLPHRLEIIQKIGNILFVNDSKATNPHSAVQALEIYIGYKIFWLVGGISKIANPFDICENHIGSVQKIFFFGQDADNLEQVFANKKPMKKCQTITQAVYSAYHEALKEKCQTVVLLSPMCASFDQFKNFEDRGECFRKTVIDITKKHD